MYFQNAAYNIGRTPIVYRLIDAKLKVKRFFDIMKLNFFGLAGSMIHTMHYKAKTEQLNKTVNILEKMSWNK